MFEDARKHLSKHACGSRKVFTLPKHKRKWLRKEIQDACLFADAGVIKYSAEQIEGAQQRLKKALWEYRAKHGIWPHPAILLQKVFDPADQGTSLAKAD